MSPTSTDGLPPVIACASGVWICVMSHCSPDSESLSVAGAFGKPARGGPARLAVVKLDREARAVDAALSTALSASAGCSANDELDELAITTPILS